MKEKGFPLIESLMFDDHDMVKRAATECVCNMVMCEEVSSLLADRFILKGLICNESIILRRWGSEHETTLVPNKSIRVKLL